MLDDDMKADYNKDKYIAQLQRALIDAEMKIIAMNRDSALMSISEINDEVSLCATMFEEGRLWATSKDPNTPGKAFSNAYHKYYSK